MRRTLALFVPLSFLYARPALAEEPAIEISIADGKCVVSSGPTGEYPVRFVKSASDRALVTPKRVRVNGADTQTVTLGSIATKFDVQFDTESKKDARVTCDAPAKVAAPREPAWGPGQGAPPPAGPPWRGPEGPGGPPWGSPWGPPPAPPSWGAPPPRPGPDGPPAGAWGGPVGAPPPPMRPLARPAEEGPDERDGDGRRDGTLRSDAALRWLTEEHFKNLHKTPGHYEENGVWVLYHLPDGRPAFPLPPHITEHQRVRLRVVVPEGAGARFTVEACGDVPSFKTETSFQRGPAPHGRRASRADGDKFAVVDYTQDLQCTKNLAYTVAVKDGGEVAATKTSLAIDSVQRFFVAGGIMFDFAAPQKLSLNDRPTATGSEKYIELAHHFAGFRPLVTLGVYPCEANPKDWKLCNMFSPIIAIDPTRLDQGAGLGLQVSPVHGLGIAMGADVYLSQKIPDQVKAKPGDTWTAPGDLPVDKRFDAQSFGGFLGATVTLDTITSVFQ